MVLGAVILLLVAAFLASLGLGIIGESGISFRWIGGFVALGVGLAVIASLIGAVGGEEQGAQEGGATGSPERGQAFFVGQGGCGTCHAIDGVPGAVGTIGPPLTDIAEVAATRKPGMTADAYIRESEQNPNAFVAPGFQAVMPPGLATGQNLEDVIAFLLAPRPEP